MTWAFVAHRGSANNKTSGTTLQFLLNGAIPAGDVLIVRCVTDAVAGDPTGETTNHQKVEAWQSTTLRGTATKIMEYTRTGNVTISLWLFFIIPGNSFDTTINIRLTLVTAVTAKVMGGEDFSQAGNQAPRLVGKQAADGSSTTPSVSLSGLTGAGTYLFIGHVGIEGPNGDAFTQDADYANNTSVGTTGGGATSNVASRWGSRIATLSGDTYNPVLGTSRAWVDMLVALEEQTSVAQSLAAQHERLGIVRSQRQVVDDFDRPTGELGDGWASDLAVNLFLDVVDTVDSGHPNGVLECGASNVPGGVDVEGFVRRTDRLGPDQFVEILVRQLLGFLNWPSTYRMGPGVRCSGTRASFTGYAALYRDTSGSQGIELRRFVGESLVNGGTVLGSWAGTILQGQTWGIEAEGTTVRVKVAGATVISVTDTAISWGFKAFVSWGLVTTVDFVIGDFGTWTSGDLALDWTMPHHAIGFVTRALTGDHEALTPAAATRSAVFEALGPVAQNLTAVLEALGYQAVSRDGVQESLGPVARSLAVPWETLAAVLQSGVVPWESLLGVVAVSRDAITPLEALGYLVALALTPHEARAFPRPRERPIRTVQDLEIETRHWIRQQTSRVRRVRRRGSSDLWTPG